MKLTRVYSFLPILMALCLSACGSVTPTFQPAVTVVLAPDTRTTVSSEDLDAARRVMQERLDALAPASSRVTVDGGNLKMELGRVANPDMVIAGTTHAGIIEFWESSTPLETGMTVPTNLVPALTGMDIAKARAEKNQADNTWQVLVEFTPKGADTLAQLTASKVGQYLALSRDRQIVTSPRIQAPIRGGPVAIAGAFTEGEARSLAAVMSSGALPIPLKIISVK